MAPSLAVNETSDVMLSCVAEADPAPEVVLRSPTNEQISVRPPSDRKQTRTPAIWQLRNVRVEHSGWYSCNATNAAGSQTNHTYLHVARPGDPPVDLSGLVYPMIPRAETTATSAFVTSLPATSSPPPTFRSDATPPVRDATDRFRTTGSELSTSASGAAVTSTHARSTKDTGSPVDLNSTIVSWYLTTESPPIVDSIWRRVLLIAGCVLGGLVLLAFVCVFVICCVRLCRKRLRRRRRAKSVPPAPRTIRDDCLRRPKPFPGISMAGNGDADGQALQTSPPPILPISPTYGRPERLDLLSAEHDRSCDELSTFERRRKDNGVDGRS